MTEYELNEEYFDWMCQLVTDNVEIQPYRLLLRYLHRIDFTYLLEMDGNRAADGVDLRYQFAYERKYDMRMIASYIDNRPCSVLEMMVALSVRAETIMTKPNCKDNTGFWFWGMIDSLGLTPMVDYIFDGVYVESIIHCFLDRKYQQNGEGGLFTVNRRGTDMRYVEIWHQMNYYIDTLL